MLLVKVEKAASVSLFEVILPRWRVLARLILHADDSVEGAATALSGVAYVNRVVSHILHRASIISGPALAETSAGGNRPTPAHPGAGTPRCGSLAQTYPATVTSPAIARRHVSQSRWRWASRHRHVTSSRRRHRSGVDARGGLPGICELA